MSDMVTLTAIENVGAYLARAVADGGDMEAREHMAFANNIGHFAYDNVEDVTSAAKAAWERADGVVSFVDYVEGIYVGYRFYETAYCGGTGKRLQF